MPQHTSDETKALLQEGCCCLSRKKHNGIKINIAQTARDLDVVYGTLHARFLNIHKPAREAHTTQQFISPAQENVLDKWIDHFGGTACPIGKRTIHSHAQHLHPDNKQPGKNWIYDFLKRHPNIVLSKGAGLDPKCAKAF